MTILAPIFPKSLAEEFKEHTFDVFDDDLMHDLCGKKLSKPIQTLLISLLEIERTEASFGADRIKVFEQLIPELQALRSALKDEWRDL